VVYGLGVSVLPITHKIHISQYVRVRLFTDFSPRCIFLTLRSPATCHFWSIIGRAVFAWVVFVVASVNVKTSESCYFRMVPTFVSAHTFCVSCKVWFKRHARAGVGIDAINYVTKYTTKMKAKLNFPTVAKSSLMNLYLNQEYQNSSVLLTTDC